jgi:hypothetical protein
MSSILPVSIIPAIPLVFPGVWPQLVIFRLVEYRQPSLDHVEVVAIWCDEPAFLKAISFPFSARQLVSGRCAPTDVSLN